MDKEYLIMYQTNKETTYAWFETEDDILEFVNNNKNIHVIDAIRILNCEQVL